MATLAVVSAALVPGLAPYFLFPVLVATPLLFATAFSARGWLGPGGLAARALGALAALVVWTELMVGGEAVMGIRLHPLFTVPAALGLATLMPLMETRTLPHRAWSISAGLSAGAALVVAVIAGLLPTYSEQDPQRLNLLYVQDRSGADWIVPSSPYDRGISPLPAALARAAPFRLEPLNNPIVGAGRAYVADAGEARLTTPTAQLLPVAPTGMQSGIVALCMGQTGQCDGALCSRQSATANYRARRPAADGTPGLGSGHLSRLPQSRLSRPAGVTQLGRRCA